MVVFTNGSFLFNVSFSGQMLLFQHSSVIIFICLTLNQSASSQECDPQNHAKTGRCVSAKPCVTPAVRPAEICHAICITRFVWEVQQGMKGICKQKWKSGMISSHEQELKLSRCFPWVVSELQEKVLSYSQRS